MNKRRAIQIMVNAAELYKENLEDQKILFLYGIPSEVRKQLQTEHKKLLAIKSYEAAFQRYNFLHLTGAKLKCTEIDSAIHFYQKCLDHRLMETDFSFAKDGSTVQKLDILENMMRLHWLCKRQEYQIKCAKYAFEKRYTRCDCVTGTKSLCCYVKRLSGREIFCVRKAG